jgi:hypothetical protein
MAMLAHLLGLFLSVIGPLIIWLTRKDQSTFVDDQGKEALNFQITMLIGFVAAGILSAVLIGLVLFPILWAADLILVIMASVAANQGTAYRYPVNLRLVK